MKTPDESIPAPHESTSRISRTILRFIGRIPSTRETPSMSPSDRARVIANRAAVKAATSAGALALPPGPLNWVTILPELIAVWKIQSQMIADIAGAYGKSEQLSQQQMIYCLFRHGAAMAVRDVVVRVGDRYLIRRATTQVIQHVAQKIGIRITQKAVAKSVSRWIPVIGAVGVGGYAYYDTAQVAKTAMSFFESDLELESLEGR